MASLSDKLKALGIQVGADGLQPPSERAPQASSLEELLNGKPFRTSQGETFLIEQYLPTGQSHGQASVQITAPMHGLARWAKDERINTYSPKSFAFIDTETTGLSGGSGTLAFLVGVARFESEQPGGPAGDHFHLAQFFLREPAEEPAQLAALEAFLAPCDAIVSFNGKSFDIPLLLTRFRMHGWQSPFENMIHIDLLHLARRLWRERLSNRTLGNLEVQILDATRSQDDIPGWMAPEIYAQYLRVGDTSQLTNIIYHNAMDVISLAALLDHMAAILAEPLQYGNQHGVDLISLAKLFEDLGDLQTAAELYLSGLEHEDARNWRIPRHLLIDALLRLAAIHKRQEDYTAAIELWQQAAEHKSLEAFVELAKHYEHQQRDSVMALQWTQAALGLVDAPAISLDSGLLLTRFARQQWQEQLNHRQDRLVRKLG